MINGLAVLLVGQLAGEVIARYFLLPVPGPVLGLILLAIYLFVARSGTADVEETADGLLRHLALLFVPASTGIVRYLDLLSEHAVAIGCAIAASTLATLIVTVLVFRLVDRMVTPGDGEAQ